MFSVKFERDFLRLFGMAMAVTVLATLISASAVDSSTERANATSLSLEVHAGNAFTCVLKDGGVKCVGENQFGQLGIGVIGGNRSRPVNVVGLSSGVTALEVGAFHACAIVDGEVRCWGYNAYGQLGNGEDGNSSTPVSVYGLEPGVSEIALGDYHSCAIVNGGAKCWGYNEEYGALGDGTLINRDTPVNVDGLDSGVSAIALGGSFSCAVVNRDVKCWGYNGEGELGNGSITNSSTPVSVVGLSNVDTIAAGAWHACALTAGVVKCWGWGEIGQIGDGGNAYENSTPVPVTELEPGVSAIALGGDSSCAIVIGSVKCWGENGNGQLGDGSLDDASTPVAAQNLSAVTAISVGGAHSCAIEAGDVKCWGSNSYGQRVNGTSTWFTPSGWSAPEDVSNDPSVGVSESPAVVVDSTGLATAIWTKYDGSYYVIQASTSQSGGDWSDPVTISDADAVQNAFDAKLTVDSSGRVTAVWLREASGSFQLYSSRLQRGGSWTEEEDVSEFSEDASSFDMTVDSAGLVTLVWGADLNGSVIRSSTSLSGDPWSTPEILSDPSQVASDPKVAVDPNGLATAVWLSSYGGMSIVQSSTSQSGQQWSSVSEVSDPAYPSEYPQIAVDSSGTVTVIWTNPSNGRSVIQASSRVIGEGWQSIVNVSDSDGISGDVNLAVNSSGLVAAIWIKWYEDQTEIIQVRTSELPGEWNPVADLTQDHPGCIAEGRGDCLGIPQVIVDSNGLVTATWTRCDIQCPVESSYSESGGEWSAPIAVSEDGGDAWGQRSTVDSTGLVTAVWMYWGYNQNASVIQASSISHDFQTSPPPPSGGNNSVTSSAEPPAKAEPLQEPKLTGRAKVSAVLSVSMQIQIGDSTAKLTFRWYACSKEIEQAGNKVPKSCKVIKGANKRKFKLTRKQLGKFVSVMVTSASDGNALTKLMSRSSDRVG